jgi:hypothetical protein
MSELNVLSENITALAGVNFKKINEIENELSINKDLALEFVSNPNEYMRKKLSGEFLPKNIHFHVRVGDVNFPSDTIIPDNQIVISTIIELDPLFKSDVMLRIKSLDKNESTSKPLYCEGCEVCKVAIIR